MAISIKNHEDRITALENKSASGNRIKAVKLWSGSQSSNTTLTIPGLDDYDVFWIAADFYSLNSWVVIRNQVSGLTDDVGGGSKTYATISITSGNKLQWSVLRDDYSTRSLKAVYGLKLYYNFSYNITREFYKVKFKLKHYLCSHLQKFI